MSRQRKAKRRTKEVRHWWLSNRPEGAEFGDLLQSRAHQFRQSSGSAERNAFTISAELLNARLMKVPLSFSPSPPPARPERDRNAMNGTPVA